MEEIAILALVALMSGLFCLLFRLVLAMERQEKAEAEKWRLIRTGGDDALDRSILLAYRGTNGKPPGSGGR